MRALLCAGHSLSKDALVAAAVAAKTIDDAGLDGVDAAIVALERLGLIESSLP
ncbi:MAG TPA: hypothetical protein VNG69_13940 [Casimicrobiaceae bacterium]|nr:hypothetical protein [Casimicrobiaceae bacterium]